MSEAVTASGASMTPLDVSRGTLNRWNWPPGNGYELVRLLNEQLGEDYKKFPVFFHVIIPKLKIEVPLSVHVAHGPGKVTDPEWYFQVTVSRANRAISFIPPFTLDRAWSKDQVKAFEKFVSASVPVTPITRIIPSKSYRRTFSVRNTAGNRYWEREVMDAYKLCKTHLCDMQKVTLSEIYGLFPELFSHEECRDAGISTFDFGIGRPLNQKITPQEELATINPPSPLLDLFLDQVSDFTPNLKGFVPGKAPCSGQLSLF